MPQRPGILMPASTFEHVALASCQLHGIEPWSFGWTLFCLIPAGHTGASWSWRPRPTRRSRLRGKLRSKVGQRARGAADDLRTNWREPSVRCWRGRWRRSATLSVTTQLAEPLRRMLTISPPRSGPSHSAKPVVAAGRTGGPRAAKIRGAGGVWQKSAYSWHFCHPALSYS